MPRYANIGERIIANSTLSHDTFYDGTPCWVWTGKLNSTSGYPVMTTRWKKGPRKGKVHNIFAHRESLKFFRGVKVGTRYVVMHKCNVKTCVNPMHLERGSQMKNMQQCVADGRHQTPFRKAA